jgi:hypothetical protein
MKRHRKTRGLRRSELRSFAVLGGLSLAIWGISFFTSLAGAT